MASSTVGQTWMARKFVTMLSLVFVPGNVLQDATEFSHHTNYISARVNVSMASDSLVSVWVAVVTNAAAS